jgi:hypothetical protein
VGFRFSFVKVDVGATSEHTGKFGTFQARGSTGHSGNFTQDRQVIYKKKDVQIVLIWTPPTSDMCKVDGIIFVLDSCDGDRISVAHRELQLLLE